MIGDQILLGNNLRAARKKKRISLQEIADNVGVSKSFLSQVENGKTWPSLSTLKEITTYLNISISSLLEEEQPSDLPVVTKEQRKRMRYSNGITMEMLSIPQPFKQIQPMHFSLEPGATSGEKKYRHFGQEFVYVLKGTLNINLADSSYVLHEGDSIYFESNTPHSFFNPSKSETTEALWIDTPPTF